MLITLRQVRLVLSSSAWQCRVRAPTIIHFSNVGGLGVQCSIGTLRENFNILSIKADLGIWFCQVAVKRTAEFHYSNKLSTKITRRFHVTTYV